MTTHFGGCHCGRVRFEVSAPADIKVTRCNCSVCRMTGHLHLIVPKSDFRLTSGQDDLEGSVASQEISDFDGANWEQNIDKLSPISD